jgi:hypothetical protein
MRAARVAPFVALAGIVLSGCGATTHSAAPSHDNLGAETLVAAHSCGYLAIGKGWRVRASSSVSCESARHLMRVFFATHKCLAAQRQPGEPCTLAGYACLEVPSQPDNGVVWCSDARQDITATSNP